MRDNNLFSDKDIGEAIRTRRMELGLTQEALAERIGVTSQQLQRYEYGKTRLKLENLQNIAHALEIPVAHFFGERHQGSDVEPIARMTQTERKLVEEFRKIGDGKVRDLVVKMVKHAAGEE